VTRTDTGDLEVFAAAVAHEIRTPLSAVAGEVEVALRRQRSARGIPERSSASLPASPSSSRSRAT
jgi:signal transduction histidine kinase